MGEPRVIFVNRVYWPSTEATAQLLTDLAENLAARGWEVHVVAAGETSTRHHSVVIHRTGAGDKHGGMISRIWNYRRFLQKARVQLTALLRRGDIVVALTDPPMLGAMVAEVAQAADARVVHWIQDIYPEIAEVHFGALARPFVDKLKLRRNQAWQSAAACVALGEDMAAVVRASGIAPERVRVLPNWAPRELHEPAPAAQVAARRRELKLDGRFVVAYSGNLGRVHEFATLLDAAHELRDRVDIDFLFIGRGARLSALERQARRRGLVNVRLLPPEPRATLPTALAVPDVHLVTLRPEYGNLVYPSKLAGVLAAARPVISVGPAGGDIARLLAAEECGRAFAPGEAEEVAETIRAWRTDAVTVGTLGARARTAYLRHFTAAALLDDWDRLLGGVRDTP